MIIIMSCNMDSVLMKDLNVSALLINCDGFQVSWMDSSFIYNKKNFTSKAFCYEAQGFYKSFEGRGEGAVMLY